MKHNKEMETNRKSTRQPFGRAPKDRLNRRGSSGSVPWPPPAPPPPRSPRRRVCGTHGQARLGITHVMHNACGSENAGVRQGDETGILPDSSRHCICTCAACCARQAHHHYRPRGCITFPDRESSACGSHWFAGAHRGDAETVPLWWALSAMCSL